MKTSTILLLLLLVLGVGFAKAASSKFYITSSTTNEKEHSFTQYFEGRISEALKKNFPCAECQTRTDVVEELKWEKSKQLMGVSDGNAMESIMESMKCDYLISLNIRIDNNTASINAFCADAKRVKVLSRSSSISQADDVLKTIDNVARELIERLKQYEICPFVGPVSISLNSELDSISKFDYDVYCNGADQQFHSEHIIDKATLSDWKLEKKHRRTSEGFRVFYAEGNMTFSSNEKTRTIEENGCYKCKSGRVGGRTFTQTNSMKVEGSGITMESTLDGKPAYDASIELKFLENDTYLIIVKGTSQMTKGEEKVVTKAEGTCDNIPTEIKTVKREISIPLNVAFGPYIGKSTDKLLQQKDTKVMIDPVNKEKQTVTIDFNLTQKEK